ncbi:MAG: ATP-dependent DNA helicase RecG [Clostridium sp.]|nr:ATP-dependent DNA helicase RecG [Clostridium sp.]MCM1400191.1 ATP-dependent DNA helicase RecG [Clostridium sp.]MCM1460940.1 ATP-dependent DNA helicase RecG [Bacteroides sp.]
MNFGDDIKTIKGVGDKTAAAFKRIGVDTVDDLVHTFPRNYLTYDEVIGIKEAKPNERVAVMAVISSYVDVRTVRSLKLTNISVKDSTGTLKITWFNSPYLKNVLHKGDTYVFVGTIKIKNNSRVMDMPEYYRPNVYEGMRQVMQPVYPLTQGLSNKTVMKTVAAVRPIISSIRDYIPEEIRETYDLMELCRAYDTVHYPMNESVLKLAIKRLAFDEFYRFLADMGRLRVENIKQQNIHKIVQGKAVADFVEALPYRLTKGQADAIDDILKDMGSENVMNRLVQGDVGSGKTIVAETALFACVKEGYQGALMVPTEVLAKQHYEELLATFEPYKIHVECLVGSTPLKEKRRIYESIRHGMTDILIGTHALIEDKVDFANLGLVVTDEQHRFGVEQRKKLANKGTFPHVLVMSATPIPRTLAIIMYADLDISVISQMPKGRKPIKNCVVGTGYRATAYGFIASQVQQKGQVYVICPMVNDSETLDVTNVTDYTDTLKQALGQQVNVCMLHGQMKAAEKNEIMEKFLDGEIDVLVSTTVIEVGINNPNATVMMVENAERFGLAQLHQLRGRVGRGKKQSYCIFIDGKESQESQERLKVLENSNDGFFIANEDLKLRGPGDFFGIRQSGEALFTLADIYNHADMLKLAQDAWNSYGATLLDGEERTGNLESTVL